MEGGNVDFLHLVNSKKATEGHGFLPGQLTPHWNQKEVNERPSKF